jgi:F0F1-type ATP synthase membrane subunit b/b'
MSIVLFLGADVNEYRKKSQDIITKAIAEGQMRCEHCNQPLNRHSSYTRGIKETGEQIEIIIVSCKNCKDAGQHKHSHALLPDFILPRKHYSAYEIEKVIGQHASQPVSDIDTEASESTVRRWIEEMEQKMQRAINSIKWQFIEMKATVSEIRSEAKTRYEELVDLLKAAPKQPQSSNSQLGLANLWLGIRGRGYYL